MSLAMGTMRRVGWAAILAVVAVAGWAAPVRADVNALEGYLNVPRGWASETVCVAAYNPNLTHMVAQDCGPQGSGFALEGLVPGVHYALRFVDADTISVPWSTYQGQQIWLGNVDHPYDTTFVSIPAAGRWWIDVFFFDDITKASPFYWEISWMGSAGVSTGYDNGTYRPAAPVSRMAMSAFLYRVMDVQGYTPPAVSPFQDVATSHPFYTEIAWMADADVSTGYQDGTFRPLATVSRMAMSAFLFRLGAPAQYAAPQVSPFDDVAPTHQFYEAIAWMAEAGISTGYLDQTYQPNAPVTRLAMAAFLYRLAELVNTSA